MLVFAAFSSAATACRPSAFAPPPPWASAPSRVRLPNVLTPKTLSNVCACV
jgi:hypothetical protein